MRVHQAYRYELDPTAGQTTSLFHHAGAARFVWNWGLSERIDRYRRESGDARFTNARTQQKDLVRRKKQDFVWMQSISSWALLCPLYDLDTAFARFYEGCGFPKYKKKGRTRDRFRLRGYIHARGRKVKLPRLGWIRTKESTRRLKGRILNATVSREADRWFVSFCVERERPDPVRTDSEVVGIDLGLTHFATLSDGTKIEAPRPLRKRLKKLRRLSQQHSKKQKGSRNRQKSALRLARLHRKIRNTRNDFLHKLTTRLTRTKSVIVVENLNVAGMMRNRRLSRAISDAGWGEFKRQLGYKSKWYGAVVGEAGRFFPSSKLCSVCEYRVESLPLSIRAWTCPNCGASHDRDVNAARNLRKLGLRNLDKIATESSSGSHACGDPSAGDAVSAVSRYGSTKQESRRPRLGSR